MDVLSRKSCYHEMLQVWSKPPAALTSELLAPQASTPPPLILSTVART